MEIMVISALKLYSGPLNLSSLPRERMLLVVVIEGKQASMVDLVAQRTLKDLGNVDQSFQWLL
jgi:hypothetical protein